MINDYRETKDYISKAIGLDTQRQDALLSCTTGDAYCAALMQRSIFEDLPVYTFSRANECDISFSSLCKKIESLGGRLFTSTDCNGEDFRVTYVWPDGEMNVRFEDPRCIRFVSFLSIDVNLFNKIKSEIDELPKKENDGAVSVILSGPSGLYTKSIGIGGITLERANYTEETLSGYDSIVKDILSKKPLGRLAIIDGPPGTGKTFIVRGLLNEAKQAKFLILPSNAAEDMSGPGILNCLIDLSNNNDCDTYDLAMPFEELKSTNDDPGSSPVVLIIEDADRCLSRRKSDNISAISTILNLSDGIIGNLLDLRIICTTNAEISEMDDALLRPGRLSSRIEVGLLPKDKAIEVFNRITKDTKGIPEINWDDRFYSLAQIYSMAKGKDGTPQQIKKENKRTVGFGANES